MKKVTQKRRRITSCGGKVWRGGGGGIYKQKGGQDGKDSQSSTQEAGSREARETEFPPRFTALVCFIKERALDLFYRKGNLK